MLNDGVECLWKCVGYNIMLNTFHAVEAQSILNPLEHTSNLIKQSLASAASKTYFLTCSSDDNGSTFFSGRTKIGLLNCPNTLQQDHLMEQNLNEISLSAKLMDWSLHRRYTLLEFSACKKLGSTAVQLIRIHIGAGDDRVSASRPHITSHQWH